MSTGKRLSHIPARQSVKVIDGRRYRSVGLVTFNSRGARNHDDLEAKVYDRPGERAREVQQKKGEAATFDEQ